MLLNTFFARSRYFLTPVAFVSLILVASVAVAAIIGGTSTVGQSSNVTYSKLSLLKPADTVTGDVLLATIALKNGSDGVVFPPFGWTLIERTDNGANIGLATYYHIFGVSEPGEYDWLINPAAHASGGITRYSGVDTTNPIDASGGLTGLSLTASAPSITTTSSGDKIVAVFAARGGDAAGHFSTSPGLTEQYDTGYTSNGPSISLQDMTQAVVGPTATQDASITGITGTGRNWATQQIALRAQASLAAGLTHYWKLDENSGNASDSIGSMILTNINGAAYNAGKINNAVHLVRANNQTLHNTATIHGSPLTAYTVNVWFKLDSLPTNNTQMKLFVYQNTDGAMQLNYENNSGTRQWKFRHFNVVGSATEVTVNQELSVGVWYMGTLTWDGSIITGYIDGVSVGVAAISQLDVSDLGGLVIGSDGIGVGGVDGYEDEIGFWTRTLSGSEISALYNGGAGNQYPF